MKGVQPSTLRKHSQGEAVPGPGHGDTKGPARRNLTPSWPLEIL